MSLQKILEGAQNLEEITETSRLLAFEIRIKFMTLDPTCNKYSDLIGLTVVSILHKIPCKPHKKPCKLHNKPGIFCLPMASLLLGNCLYTKLLGIVART